MEGLLPARTTLLGAGNADVKNKNKNKNNRLLPEGTLFLAGETVSVETVISSLKLWFSSVVHGPGEGLTRVQPTLRPPLPSPDQAGLFLTRRLGKARKSPDASAAPGV